MPEIKHTFHAGKMDKDVDERLIKNGEYRDALNIQVRTTDGDSDGLGDAGTIQNIKGNEKIPASITSITSYIDDDSSGNKDLTRIIGSIADEANDRAFFFIAAPVPYAGIINGIPYSDIVSAGLDENGVVRPGNSLKSWVDSIFEMSYNLSNGDGGIHSPIFTDVFMLTGTYLDVVGDNVSSSTDYAYITVPNTLYGPRQIRVGMTLHAWDSSGNHLLHNTVTQLDTNEPDLVPGVEVINVVANGTDKYDIVLAEKQTANLESNCVAMKFFSKERVLEFDYYKSSENTLQRVKNVLTGINIIDDLLFWSDGNHEPKKINIERSRAGTINDTLHTKLYVTHPVSDDLVILTDPDIEPDLISADIKQEHITVIRKAPQTAPVLKLAISDRQSDTTFEVDYQFGTTYEGAIINDIVFPDDIDCRVDDVFKFTADNLFANEPSIVRGKIINIDGDIVVMRLVFVSEEVAENDPLDWQVELEQRKPLFETKFGRFAYRYKYDDGEYSSFSPWSELAFLPGDFEYSPSKGYNKAMVSNVRSLIIRGFIPSDVGNTAPIISVKPSDVKAVDILWKTTDNAGVYVVKTIFRVRDLEWEAAETGSMTVTSEMIHKVLPANQTLRGWDNVPRKAIAQEMTANRLIYGNYIQGYDIKTAFGLKQSITSTRVQFPNPRKSVKSSRNYKFGAVFGDKYGRETPVIANGYKNTQFIGDTELEENITGDLNVEKSLSAYSNKFQIEQSWDTPEPAEWMKYIKYFVKETSNEYYNLIMDRWYDAEDGNVWVAFPSVDRNKIDEETFLVLKNAHGSQKVVTEEARYKVIAIENDAPDYIKTVNNDYDLIAIARDQVYSGSESDVTNAIPDSLIDNREIDINSPNWMVVAPDTKDFKGIAKARIVGTYTSATDGAIQAESPWRNLSKIINEGTDDEPGNKGVVFREKFEETDVNMYQKLLLKLSDPSELTNNTATVDNDGGTGYIQYNIQLRDAVVENAPQFDGRFFVKLEKDATLETTVLGNQISYEVQATYKIAYIAAKSENPANTEAESLGTYNNISSDVTANDWPGNIFTAAEIGWDDSWNTLSNLQDPENFEAVPNGHVSIETINENADGEHATAGLEKNQTVPLFGPGDHSDNQNKTEQFWNWWWDQGSNLDPDSDGTNTARDTNIFIDQAPAYSGFSKIIVLANEDGTTSPRQVLSALNSGYNPISHLVDDDIYGPYPEGATYPFPPYTFEWDDNTSSSKQNWMPRGLSNGAFQNGHLGQFTFSVIKDDWNTISTDALFKNAMTTIGTVFRFANDPNNNHYKIKAFTLSTDWLDGFDGFGSFSNGQELTIESKNFASNDSDLRKRYSIITRFCKLDGNNNEVPTEGIDIDLWDPRGEVRHDGIGSLNIQVLTQVGNFDLSDKSLATNAACWETEPKEDIGLDIYYEASEAIPVRLENKKDLINFTKPSPSKEKASNIEFYRYYKKLPTDSIPYVSAVLGNDAVQAKYQYYEYLNGVLVQTPYVIPFTNNVGINDIIYFIHKSNPYSSGIITKSKIIDHYDTLSSLPGNTVIPILSPRATRTGMAVIQNIDGTMYTVITGANIGNSIDGNSIVGAQVIGDGIGGATFVLSANDGQVVLSNKVNAGYLNINANYTFITITGWFKIDTNVWNYPIGLGWFNCYSFGNGVESDRIRDDFNAPTIDNGVKVSSTFLEYGKEHIGSGLIYSGLYNSTSSVNDLNEFNMAEKITKNLNPTYGSIQALKTSERNLTVFAEDKILKVLANKDAIYNADGNPQLTATNRVLGDATPYAGDFGISKNPESLAWDQYRMYFTDKQRGAVLRLSNDGLTPISDVGMRTYFRNRMKKSDFMLGTFDTVNGEYNLTLNSGWQWNASVDPPTTISFNERSKGWVSFKSFIPSTGVSVNGRYLTAPGSDNQLDFVSEKLSVWEHYSDNVERNSFYSPTGVRTHESEVEVIFNDQPSIVKSFKTINYEGTQSKVTSYTGSTVPYGPVADGNTVSVNDGEYYNLTDKNGWQVESFETDLQTGTVPEFINKENKWFNKINGVTTTLTNLDPNEFSVQGIGFPLGVTSTLPEDANVIISDTFDGLTGLYGDDDLTND